MKNYREQVKRIMLQSEYLLSLKATAIYVTAIIIGILFSLASIYRAYSMIAAFGFFGGVLLVIVLISIAGTMIDEINEGQSQLYLATGLSRLEYVISWIIVSIIYPVIAIMLSIILPVMIIDPATLFNRLAPSPGYLAPSIFTFAIAISLQLFSNVSLGILFGVITKKKGIAYLVIIIVAFILPITIGILSSLLGAITGNYEQYQILNIVIIPFDPLLSYIIFSYGPIRLSELAILIPPFITGMVSLFITTHYAKNKLEV